MNAKTMKLCTVLAFVLFAGLLLVPFAGAYEKAKDTKAQEEPVFSYDKTAISNLKPWTAKKFRNDPNNFQFVIIGDRTGGANVQGTFKLAMDQINLLQPEFVINVGDIIEGYAKDKGELKKMWDEADGWTGKLQMPFFYVRGNHDVAFPGGKEGWLERFGVGYYYFVYKNVLFMVLDTEVNRPEPPPDMHEKIQLYNKLQAENLQKAKELLAEFMKSDAVAGALSKPAEFPQKQMAWIKKTLTKYPDVR